MPGPLGAYVRVVRQLAESYCRSRVQFTEGEHRRNLPYGDNEVRVCRGRCSMAVREAKFLYEWPSRSGSAPRQWIPGHRYGDTSALPQGGDNWDDRGELTVQITHGLDTIHHGVRAGSDCRLWHTGVAGIPPRTPGGCLARFSQELLTREDERGTDYVACV